MIETYSQTYINLINKLTSKHQQQKVYPLKLLQNSKIEETKIYNNILLRHNQKKEERKEKEEGKENFINESYKNLNHINNLNQMSNLNQLNSYNMNILESNTLLSNNIVSTEIKEKNASKLNSQTKQVNHHQSNSRILFEENDSFVDEEEIKEKHFNPIKDENIFKDDKDNKEDKFSLSENIYCDKEDLIENDYVESNSFFQNSIDNAFDDEYVDDDDPGFDLFQCEIKYFKDTCKRLSEQYGFPSRAIKKSKPGEKDKPVNVHNKNDDSKSNSKLKKESEKNESNLKSIKVLDQELVVSCKNNGEKLFEIQVNENEKNEKNERKLPFQKKELLPSNAKFMSSGDKYYPILFNNTIYDSFLLKVIVDRERTGFEESKEFKIIINSLIAGRYQVLEYLGSAVFSKAIKCLDIMENRLVCLKIISNNKDYLDQSIDEIKIMRYINANADMDEKNIIILYDYFYHKEHLFLVTEILKDNLYEFYKHINDKNLETYFTLHRIQSICKQILVGLEFIHSLNVIHCDLKPENILIKSISKSQVKIIDFGSSCFIHDHLSSYMQSRSYRAPEVILGVSYDFKIDIWSLGCIAAELFTGNVLFQNDSIQSYLAKILSICGPFPEYMFKGKHSNEYFSKEKLIYMEVTGDAADNSQVEESENEEQPKEKQKKMHVLIPKRTYLKARLKCDDEDFVDFIRCLCMVDQNIRPSASEALKHSFLSKKYD